MPVTAFSDAFPKKQKSTSTLFELILS